MGRSPCCAKEGLNRGSWSVREDQILYNYISVHGEGKWRDLPQRAGLKRCGKSCRLRWLNYLKPDIKRGNISVEEEDLIIKLHQLLGNRWALIAGRLPGRTDNEIKNYWNTNLSKRVEDRHKSQDSPKKQDDKKKKKELTEKFSSLGSGQLKEVVEPHQVIRTKATRCTRVIIPQHLHNNNNMVTTKKHLVPVNNSHDTTSQFSSPAQDKDKDNDVSSNFLMDFDIGELFISDILDSDIFHNKVNDNHDGENENYAFDDENNNNNNNTSSDDSAPCDQGMLDESTNEMSFLENWKANVDVDDDDDQQPLQLNEALELKKLANFFNLDELDEK